MLLIMIMMTQVVWNTVSYQTHATQLKNNPWITGNVTVWAHLNCLTWDRFSS